MLIGSWATYEKYSMVGSTRGDTLFLGFVRDHQRSGKRCRAGRGFVYRCNRNRFTVAGRGFLDRIPKAGKSHAIRHRRRIGHCSLANGFEGVHGRIDDFADFPDRATAADGHLAPAAPGVDTHNRVGVKRVIADAQPGGPSPAALKVTRAPLERRTATAHTTSTSSPRLLVKADSRTNSASAGVHPVFIMCAPGRT